QAQDGIRDRNVTGVQTCALPISVVHRRQELRASQAMQDRAINDPKIEFLFDSEVAEVHGEDSLTGLTIRSTVTGETTELPVTGKIGRASCRDRGERRECGGGGNE